MVTSTQDTFKASSDGASRSNEVSILAGETYDDKLTPEEDHGDVSDEHKIATCIPKEAREAASDPEEPLPQAIRDQRSEDDLRSYLNSIFEKIGDGADEAKNAKYGEIEELGVSPGLARRGRVYNKALGEAKEGSAIEASLLRTLEIDEQLATCLRAGTSCRKISCWAARYNMVNIAMALVRRNIAMALVAGKPDPLPEEVLAIAVEYGHVQLVERLTKLQHGVDVNRGRWDFPGAGWWTNAGAGAVPRRLTDDWHLNEFERHGFKFLVPICSAARMGNVQMVKTLSECDKITDVEWALHWAAIMGHHHVVLELLNSKREVDVNKPVYNMTDPILRDACSTGSHVFNPLHIASFYGHVSVVKALCEDRLRRLRANTASEGGVTAVQMAGEMGHVQILNYWEYRPWDRYWEDRPEVLWEDMSRRLRANTASEGGVTAVQIAAEMGHVQIVNILLERPEVEIAWALHGAAKKGHREVVEELLNSEKEVDVNTLKQEILDDAQDRSSFVGEFNPLHLASIYGHASVVQALCEDRKRRLQVNSESKPAGVTAVQMAAEMGHAQTVKILLERPEVEIAWALHGAAKKGHREVVEELLNSEKEVHVNTLKQEILDDAQDRSSFGEEFNPLHLASIYGHASVVQALCEDSKRRLQVNSKSGAGVTAVQMAAEMGHAQTVKILLERPEVEIAWALHGAAKKGHREVVEELLNSEKEVHVNTLKQEILDDAQDRSSFGEEFNPLHLASIYGHASVVQALCEDRKRRLQVNSKSGAGVTAVQMAAEMGHAQTVKILLERPEVEIAWALHGAAKKGHRVVVEELLNSEKEVHVNTLKQEILDDAQDRSSFVGEFNPLHLASIYGHASVVQALCEDMKRRLQVESKSGEGVTAVQMAAEMGHAQTVKILLERPEVEIAWALHGAAKKGHREVVEELLNSEKEVHVNTLKQELLDDAQDRSSFGEEFNPLHLASIYGHASVVQALCEDSKRRLQVNIESKPAGVKAVQMAAEMGHVEIVHILLERPGVEIAWALHGAVKKGHDDLVKILLERHEVEPRPTLCKAVKLGLDDVVLKLLKIEKEMDVNTLEQEILDDPQDRLSFGKEFNPLHLASLYGHVKVVQALCTATTLRANMESGAGMTAFQIARRKGRAEIENFLLDRTDVQKYLDRLYRDRQVHVDAANAILVGATLIASVTFAAWLQPPLGYSDFYGSTSVDVAAPLPSGMYPSFVSVAGHPILDIFWISNSMSFLFAIATLMVGANAARPPRQDKDIGEVVRTLRTLLSLAYRLLSVSVGCVLGAFATAGFVVLPPVRRYTVTMGATLGIGLVVVFLSWTSSWISSKVLYVLKIIKEFFSNNP